MGAKCRKCGERNKGVGAGPSPLNRLCLWCRPYTPKGVLSHAEIARRELESDALKCFVPLDGGEAVFWSVEILPERKTVVYARPGDLDLFGTDEYERLNGTPQYLGFARSGRKR